MKLKLSNPHYTNTRGTVDNIRNGTIMFDVIVEDLDNEILTEPIPYTFVDYDFENEDLIESEIRKYIKSQLDNLKIDYYQSNHSFAQTLYEYRTDAIYDINCDFDFFIKKYDCIEFNEDIFDYSLDTQQIINSIISDYDYQIQSGKITKQDIKCEFISISNAIHVFTYDQLLELRSKIINRFTKVKLYARRLKDKVVAADNIDDIKAVVWDEFVFDDPDSLNC